MEQAFTVALQKFFTAKPTGSEKKGSNPRTEFYAKYKQEAEHADKDFQKKYEEDLNTTLIFVGLPPLVALTQLTRGYLGRSFLSSDFRLRSQYPKCDPT